MNKVFKKILSIGAIVLGFVVLIAGTVFINSAMTTDAKVAANNLTAASDNFEIRRRIIFYNGITGEYILVIEGLCSIGSTETIKGIAVTCKTGQDAYKKHILALSDNVTVVAEQVESAAVSQYQYRVVFKPQAVIPDVEIRK